MVINHNRSTSICWVLWILLEKYRAWRWSWWSKHYICSLKEIPFGLLRYITPAILLSFCITVSPSLLNHSLKKILLLVYKYTVILPYKIDNSLFIPTLLLVTTPFSTSLHSKTLRKQLSIQYLAISNFSTSILLSPFQSGFYPNTLPKLLLSSHKESNSHSQFSSYLTYQQHLK